MYNGTPEAVVAVLEVALAESVPVPLGFNLMVQALYLSSQLKLHNTIAVFAEALTEGFPVAHIKSLAGCGPCDQAPTRRLHFPVAHIKSLFPKPASPQVSGSQSPNYFEFKRALKYKTHPFALDRSRVASKEQQGGHSRYASANTSPDFGEQKRRPTECQEAERYTCVTPSTQATIDLDSNPTGCNGPGT
jgi:hypothetical protein